jgi:hypothetical protein
VKDIWQFFIGIIRHWIPLITGGSITAALGVLEHKTGSSVPWSWYAAILLLFFFFSCFSAWRDEYRKRITLEEQAKPKLSIQFRDSSQRPEMQDLVFPSQESGFVKQRLFRVAIHNESSILITDAQLVLEAVESDQNERFFPGHALRVMGSTDASPRFNIAAGATQWVDLAGCFLEVTGERYFVPYAELGEQAIPCGQHKFILRADGGGLPCRVNVTVDCPLQGLVRVIEFHVLQ